MEKGNVKCHGICKTCAICKNLKEECHKRDEIAKAFMSEDFSNIYCTNHTCEIASAAELISRLGEFYMSHKMSDHLYRYIGSQVYGNDYIKDCLNNVAKEDEKSDKKRLSDEFLIKTHDLYFRETGAEEDEFKSYYKFLDQALEYIKSIGGFPENMVTGGDYTPAYNRAANIINECILNKEHDVKLIDDPIKADEEHAECSSEEDEDEKVREININYVFNIVQTSNSETYTFSNISYYPMLYKKFKDLMYDFRCNRSKQWDYQKFYDMMKEATEICDDNLPFGNLNMSHIRKEMHLWLSEIEKDVMDFTNLNIYYSKSIKACYFNKDFVTDVFQFVDENLDYSFILKFRHEAWDYNKKED